jgi:hypothetical protein
MRRVESLFLSKAVVVVGRSELRFHEFAAGVDGSVANRAESDLSYVGGHPHDLLLAGNGDWLL